MVNKVAIVGGGISRYEKPRRDTFEEMVTEAVTEALEDNPKLDLQEVDNHVCSYFSDHFAQQLAASWIPNDYLGLTPKPITRVENGGAGPGTTLRAAWAMVASGITDFTLVTGFEKMGEVGSSKANEFIAIASDSDFDLPVGGYYTGYYAAMMQRHMYLFGTTEEDMALIAVKNRNYALDNPYAQWPVENDFKPITVDDVLDSRVVAWPLKILDCCLLSEGASCVFLASEDVARKYTDTPVWISGVGLASDMMRPGDRPDNPGFAGLFPDEYDAYPAHAIKPREPYPDIANFGACRMAARQSYKMAGITDPYKQIDLFEIHDAYDSAELQTYEDLELVKRGHGKDLIHEGQVYVDGDIPCNISGGLEGFGHPVGSTAIAQTMECYWQLTQQIGKKHLSPRTQVDGCEVALNHSHAGTGTALAVMIMDLVKDRRW
jgi:acetyl-CoA C-acetyltransferase